MNPDHKTDEELQREIDDASTVVTIGGTYQHYKGADKLYTVTGLGFLEATDEICVIYHGQYNAGHTFIRPVSVWLEQVEYNGQTVPRFKKISNER
jgi:hypothetical protein